MPRAQVELRQPPAFLSGAGYGLTQRLARGTLHVRLDARANAQALRSALGMSPDASGATALTPRLLAGWLLERAGAMQREARIPVFDAPRLHLAPPLPDGATPVGFMIPWFSAKLTQALLQALAGVFSRALDLAPGDAGMAGAQALAEELARIGRALRPHAVQGTNTYRFLAAAHAQRIPFERVVGNVFRYGQGVHARWLDSSFSDRTPNISARIARQKTQTAAVLRDHGFPVPEHALAKDAEEALAIAARLGYPVVVKPADRDGGVGVAAGLAHPDEVAAAYAAAREASSRILVERHVDGDDHRLTIFQGRMIKAVRRIPGGVTGDGLLSVAALVDRINADPVRVRRNASRGRTLLCLDDEALALLAQRGLDREYVPAAGEYIALRRRANISTGGEPVLVTDAVHPDNRRLAERAAATLRLDMAGVDLIVPDISRSWLETGGGICEVNAQPQIGEASTPEIYATILREMFPRSSVPVVLALCARRAPAGGAFAAALRDAIRAAGLPCAIAARDGAWDGEGHRLCADGDVHRSVRALVGLPQTEALLVVADPAEILRHGLPVERVVALALDPDERPDHRLVERALTLAVPNVERTVVARIGDAAMAWLEANVARERLQTVPAGAPDALSAAVAAAVAAAVSAAAEVAAFAAAARAQAAR